MQNLHFFRAKVSNCDKSDPTADYDILIQFSPTKISIAPLCNSEPVAWHIGQRVLAPCELRPSEANSAFIIIMYQPTSVCTLALLKILIFAKVRIHLLLDFLNKQTCHFTLVPLHFYCNWKPTLKRSPQISLKLKQKP